MSTRTAPGTQVLLATSMVSAVLGTVHAFSVFLIPLETAFGVSRATVSLTYSFALVCLTLTVLAGPMVYTRYSPPRIFMTVAILGGAGATMAAFAEGIGGIWLGYSLAFGVANGLGYGFGLQFAARALPDRAGFAMGVVTAAYALGAAVAPAGFEALLTQGGFRAAMLALATVLLITGLLAAWIVAGSGVVFSNRGEAKGASSLPARNLALIWLAYGLAVSAGLMAIGHAAGIAESAGFTGWLAPVVLAVCNLAGSLVAGQFADRTEPARLLSSLATLSALALGILALAPYSTLAALGAIGFAYGGTIAAYPAAIARLFPGDAGPRAYGRVFTAWGLAGLSAPWFAGRIYDATGHYDTALWAALALALGSAILAIRALSDPA